MEDFFKRKESVMKLNNYLSHRKSPGKENPWAVGTEGGKKDSKRGKRKKDRVKSGKDQITQAQRCMSLVEGCRPARRLGGRIQRDVDLKVGRIRACMIAGAFLKSELL